MNKLRIIYGTIMAIKGLTILGVIFISLFFILMANGKLVETGGPYWIIQESSIIKQVNELVSNEELAKFNDIRLSLEIPLNTGYKLLLLFFIICTSAYIIYLLDIAQRVVKDVREGNAFTQQNIRRIKTIGVLIALSMPGERILASIGNWWFERSYHFEGLKITAETHLGFWIVLVGAIIFALGVAFEQGLKLKEEHDLTI